MLGCYDIKHINRAVIEFGMSEDPFPDLGKIVAKAEAYRKQQAQYQDGGPVEAPRQVKRIAEALGLSV